MSKKADQRIEEAILLVIKAFKGRIRYGKIPIPTSTHSISVGMILLKAGCSVETVVAGTCHDLDEDTKVKIIMIIQKFGERVGEIVSTCTIDTELEKTDEDKAELLLYEKVIAAAEAGDPEPLKIKCVDSMDNLRTNADLTYEWQVKALDRGIRWLKAGKKYLKGFTVLHEFEFVINSEIRRVHS